MKIYYNQYDAKVLKEYSLEDGTSMVSSRSSWFPEYDAENKLPRTDDQILELMPSLWENGKDIITTNPLTIYWVLQSIRRTRCGLDKDDRKLKYAVARPSDVTFVSVRWDTKDKQAPKYKYGSEDLYFPDAERILVDEIESDECGSFAQHWPGGFHNIRLDVIC